LDGLTADEALIMRFGRELLESPQVGDATFNAVRARYGEQGLLELTAVMSVYTMNAAILRVMDHEAAADAERPRPTDWGRFVGLVARRLDDWLRLWAGGGQAALGVGQGAFLKVRRNFLRQAASPLLIIVCEDNQQT
jgi:hypothetical protein